MPKYSKWDFLTEEIITHEHDKKTEIVTLDEVESWVPSKIGDDRKKASADAGVARKKEQRLTIMLHRNFMEHWPFFSHKFNLSRGEKAKTE